MAVVLKFMKTFAKTVSIELNFVSMYIACPPNFNALTSGSLIEGILESLDDKRLSGSLCSFNGQCVNDTYVSYDSKRNTSAFHPGEILDHVEGLHIDPISTEREISRA